MWPVNFLKPGENDAFDTTSLFMMQLACIVNMVPKWQKLILRVCVCDESCQASFSLNNVNQSHSDRLRFLLKDLRISAELYPVNGWNQVIEGHGGNFDDYLKRWVICNLKEMRIYFKVISFQRQFVSFAANFSHCSHIYLFASTTWR